MHPDWGGMHPNRWLPASDKLRLKAASTALTPLHAKPAQSQHTAGQHTPVLIR